MSHPLSVRGATAGLVATATALTLALAGPADAKGAHGHHQPGPPLAPETHFTMAPDGSSGLAPHGAGIPNIDSVKSTIRTYYNATGGIADKTNSPYISEMGAIEASALASLPTVDPTAHKAIVFDADDTTLWTYDMEDNAMHFNFNPTLQNTWVQDAMFPATPGMVGFEHAVQAKGYAVFGITGRNSGQETATLTNLSNVGYTGFDTANFFTKWTSSEPVPAYVDCAADGNASSCSTVEYKAFTRKHIEQDLGYDIVLNVGDQFSDLQGGYADAALKLPNPTYYLPSPDIAGAPASDASLTPRTEFTMKPDGSSGLTQGGEGIPNIDSVKSTIRTYYNAPSSGPYTGIADKVSSPYISELRHLERANTQRLVNQCRREVRKGGQPAVVFDADDTTLWTYDMEDGDMRFNFTLAAQEPWVFGEKFPATPGMVHLVNAVGQAGCTVVGLTGRRADQRDATLGNLWKVGYRAFKPENYYTKWNGTAADPAIYPAGTPCHDGVCTTIEYKSATRAYVESQGYDIIANFGDQFSDLIGGYADRTVKLPNPTYYLP
ncbi:MAG TPA: HAD family acid phosphatase [Marmoricola sp.]|nr:HAD family acid phosphatase [Marmoricola sp.]